MHLALPRSGGSASTLMLWLDRDDTCGVDEGRPKVVLKQAENGHVAAKEHLHVEYDEVLNSH